MSALLPVVFTATPCAVAFKAKTKIIAAIANTKLFFIDEVFMLCA